MYIVFLLCLAGAIALALYIREKLRCYSVKALIIKAALSCLFIAVGLVGLYLRPGRFGFFVLGGLVCGLLGDIWLDLKYVYPADDRPYTYAGFVSFTAGHILFLSGLLTDFAALSSLPVLAGAAAVSLALGLATVLSGPLMKLDYGQFRGIAMLYGPFLFGTALISLVLARAAGFENTGLNLMFVGGVLFALSDLVLSGTYFGKDRERPVDIILNYVFYYGAQFIIALSVLFV